MKRPLLLTVLPILSQPALADSQHKPGMNISPTEWDLVVLSAMFLIGACMCLVEARKWAKRRARAIQTLPHAAFANC